MDFVSRPLHRSFGVEVCGFSLREPPLAAGVLREALGEHRLLFFRGQALSGTEHVQVVRCFGDPPRKTPAARRATPSSPMRVKMASSARGPSRSTRITLSCPPRP